MTDKIDELLARLDRQHAWTSAYPTIYSNAAAAIRELRKGQEGQEPVGTVEEDEYCVLYGLLYTQKLGIGDHLYAAPPAAPADKVLVPREPTDTMLEAMEGFGPRFEFSWDGKGHWKDYQRECWKMILKAVAIDATIAASKKEE